jgi:hypothetical protein
MPVSHESQILPLCSLPFNAPRAHTVLDTPQATHQ